MLDYLSNSIQESKYTEWVALVKSAISRGYLVKLYLDDNNTVTGKILSVAEYMKILVSGSNTIYTKEIPWILIVETDSDTIRIPFTTILAYEISQ